MVYKRSTDINIAGVQVDLLRFSRELIAHHSKEAQAWLVFLAVVICGYKFFSSGSFSAILTLSSLFCTFSFALLLIKLLSQSDCSGLSAQSLVLHAIALMGRLFSTLFQNGYLPTDSSADNLYQLSDVLSLVLALTLAVLMRTTYRSTYEKEKDTVGIIWPCVVAGVFAFIIHPSLNNWLPADWAWTFGLYLESLSMFPQLFLMSRSSGGCVEALTSHHVASVAASRFLAFVFWAHSYNELGPRRGKGGFNFGGVGVLTALTLQLVLLADFFYHYVMAWRSGRKGCLRLECTV